MAAVIGSLRADLSASIGNFASGFKQAADQVKSFSDNFHNVGRSMQDFGRNMSTFVTLPFLAMAAAGAKAAQESRDAMAQVNDRLKSMGDASGRTATQLEQSAKQLQRLSTFDDDDILRDVTNTMLTFGNVAGEQFDRAQRAAVDYATSMKKDLGGSSIMVGKALNDPTKGLTALGKAGVQFSDGQKAAIKSMVATGNLAGAQGIILSELERQFKGAGEAARSATPGADTIDAWRDFQETIGEFALKALEAITPFATKTLDGFTNLSTGAQGVIIGVAAIAAAIGPLAMIAGTAVSALGTLATGVMGLAGALGMTAGAGGLAYAFGFIIGVAAPFVAAIAAAAAVFFLFKDAILSNMATAWAVLQQTLGPPLAALMQSVQGLLSTLGNAFKLLASGPVGQAFRTLKDLAEDFSAIYTRVFSEVIARVLAAFVRLFTGVVRSITQLVKLVAAVLSGDWSAAWEAAKGLVVNAVDTILNVADALFPGVKSAVLKMAGAIRDVFANMVAPLLSWLGDRAAAFTARWGETFNAAVAFARGLYNGVRGWIADRLGPLIEWASARIRELRAAFGGLADEARAPGQRPAAPRQTAAPAAPPARSGAGAGSAPPAPGAGAGGGGGGRGGGGSDAAAQATRQYAQALEQLKEKLDPVSAALAAYNEGLRTATRGGLDLNAASNLLAREAVDAAGGWAVLKDRLDQLPPAVAAAARAMRMEAIASDVQAIADMASPLAAAVREYNESVAIAVEGGLKLADVEGALAAQAFSAAGGLDVWKDKLDQLPPALRAAADAALATEGAEYRADLMKTGDQLRLNLDAQYAYNEEVKRLRELLAAGAISQQVFNAAMVEAQYGFQRHLAATNPAIAAQHDAIDGIVDAIGSVIDGTSSWADAWQGLMKELLKIIVIEPMLQRLRDTMKSVATPAGGGGGGGGGWLSTAVNFASSILKFGGARAEGGPVVPGRVYMVGEEGPEPFIPKTAGTILPHGSLNDAGSSRGANITVYAPDALTTRWIKEAVQGAYQAAVRDGAQAGAQIASRVIPEQMARQQANAFV